MKKLICLMLFMTVSCFSWEEMIDGSLYLPPHVITTYIDSKELIFIGDKIYIRVDGKLCEVFMIKEVGK